MIIDKLNDILNSYTSSSSLHTFCKYVKEHIHDIPYLSIDEIALESYISKGQISKCIRKLDYKNYEEFIYECNSYLDSLNRRQLHIDKNKSIKENASIFSLELIKNIEYTLSNIDMVNLQNLIYDIKKAKHIYLYGQGDVRSSCYNMLRELNIYNIHATLCDADFYKTYSFNQDDLLIVLSTNGNSFVYDSRIIKRIKEHTINKWLISCNKDIEFNARKVIIPTLNPQYNEYMIRHILDIILLEIQA